MKLSIDELQAYKVAGWLKSCAHPDLPLLIWNYTDRCQWRGKWDAITNTCRGLVTDTEVKLLGKLDAWRLALDAKAPFGEGNVVARSFPKFHNLEENRHSPTKEFLLYEKLDGSLAILFFYKKEWIITSRGNFKSPQADRARKLLDEQYTVTDLDKEKSYVFEVIYPANKIVVNYGEREELVYLASFQKDGTETFDEQLMKFLGFPVVQALDNLHYLHVKEQEWSNAEGAVVKFSNGSRAKIKFESYKQVHRAASNVTVFEVWASFKKQQPIEELAALLPDESYAWVRNVWSKLEKQLKERLDEVRAEYDKFGDVRLSRSKFAQAVKNDRHKAVYFAFLDGKDRKVHEIMCDHIKPTP